MKYKIYIFIGLTIICVWAAYACLLINAGNLFEMSTEQRGGYEVFGQFGDAFGVMSSLMSALAFVGVVMSIYETKNSSDEQSFDSTFFQLLDHFQQIVNSIDVHRGRDQYLRKDIDKDHPVKIAEGRDALKFIISRFHKVIESPTDLQDSRSVHIRYCKFYNKWCDDLGHYFRLLYHIIKFVDERCPGDKHFYARLVRAYLSQSELTLLGYNCSVGEGRHKFAKLVCEYGLLHNLRDRDDDFRRAEIKFFERCIGEGAFGQCEDDVWHYKM